MNDLHTVNYLSIKNVFFTETVQLELKSIQEEEWIEKRTSSKGFDRNDWSFDIRFRELLGYFSLLETARIGGFIAPNDFSMESAIALEIFNRRPVRSYCEVNGIVLPQLFRVRGLEGIGLNEKISSETTAYYCRFIFMFQEFLENANIRSFLTLQYEQAFHIQERMEALTTPDEVMVAYSKNSKHPIRGLIEFADYLFELERLLSYMNDYPILQSAIWHCHTPWIQYNRALLHSVQQSLLNLTYMDEKYAKDLEKYGDAIDKRFWNVWELGNSIKELAFGPYRHYLENRINNLIEEEST